MLGSDKIIIKSPTRVDLAGGTLDMWPLYNFIGLDCYDKVYTINVAIDIFTEVQIKPTEKLSLNSAEKSSSKLIRIQSKDIQLNESFSDIESFLSANSEKLNLYKSVIYYFKSRWGRSKPLSEFYQKGFELVTASESPVGGGLGGSSSLMISLLKGFSLFYDCPFHDNHHLVKVAHNLEASLLKTPTGTQDYYPAVSGGINILKYSPDGIDQKVLNLDKDSYLAKHFLLVYTGKSHHSGINNFDVLKKSVAQDSITLQALKDVYQIALQTLEVIQQNRFDLLPDLFKKEFNARIKLSDSFASPEIHKLNEISEKNHGLGLKICGAGGGGCVLILVSPQYRQQLADKISESGFKVLPTKPVEKF